MSPAPRWYGCLLIIAAVVGCAAQSLQNGDSAEAVPTLHAHLLAVGASRGEIGTPLPRDVGRDTTALAAMSPSGSLDSNAAAEISRVVLDTSSPNGVGAHSLPDAVLRDMLAAALLRRSASGDGGALFALVRADGSIDQVHAQAGVMGLSPAGTIAPLDIPHQSAGGVAANHTGMTFNWVPNPILYIADPNRNAVVALSLIEDGPVFRIEKTRRLDAAELDLPVDLAPAVQEAMNPGFSSRKTLAGGSDIYVANRGNGTIVRMSQDGSVLAIRRIALASGGVLGPGRLNRIATSADATRIWVSIGGELPGFSDLEGAVLELPAFGPDRVADRLAEAAPDVAVQMGLGPAFNGRSCADCHLSPSAGGMGRNGLAPVLRIGKLDSHGYDPMLDRGGPVARMHSVSELGISCVLVPGIPPGANLISVRNAPALYGMGLVDTIPDAAILAGAVAHGNGIHGHPNIVVDSDGRQAVGKFGWKADVPRLELFVADALRNELGITSPLAPQDLKSGGNVGDNCNAAKATPKDDGALVDSLTAFVRSLEPLSASANNPAGSALFVETGCADCHTPALAAADRSLPLYSDLLLHNMGPALNDGVVQGQAQGSDWRTTPLWGLSVRVRYLHDGRARTIEAAIRAHGGEADPVVQSFKKLHSEQRSALLTFLSAL
jgi:mono/diheme cytochrome c family protein